MDHIPNDQVESLTKSVDGREIFFNYLNIKLIEC